MRSAQWLVFALFAKDSKEKLEKRRAGSFRSLQRHAQNRNCFNHSFKDIQKRSLTFPKGASEEGGGRSTPAGVPSTAPVCSAYRNVKGVRWMPRLQEAMKDAVWLR